MVKARLGLFSGVFLMVVATAHCWPQLAAAVCINPPVGDECFHGFLNSPVGTATIEIDGNLNLLVTGLSVPPRSTALATVCDAPGNGSEIVFEEEEGKKAGDKGFKTDKNITIGNPNHDPPSDSTAYFVQIEKYWGISCTAQEWETDPMPVGFRYSSDTITACADFHEDPIFCSKVRVEFKAGDSEGVIECQPGTLFTVPAAVGDPLMELTEVKTRALCPGNSPCGDEFAARQKATLEFVFSKQIAGIAANTGGGACTVVSGTSPFKVRKILIKPVMDEDADCAETCTPSPRANDDPLSRGGNTPPIRRISFLSESDSTASGGARVPGSYVITNEGFLIPTIGTWGLVVMVQLVLVAGTVVFRRSYL